MNTVGNAIEIIQANTISLTLSCTNTDGTSSPLVTGDTVYLTVKKNLSDVDKAFQKVVTSFTNGNAVIEIASTDTKTLPIGDYFYDIQINKANGVVTTVIPPSKFTILGRVTDE